MLLVISHMNGQDLFHLWSYALLERSQQTGRQHVKRLQQSDDGTQKFVTNQFWSRHDTNWCECTVWTVKCGKIERQMRNRWQRSIIHLTWPKCCWLLELPKNNHQIHFTLKRIESMWSGHAGDCWLKILYFLFNFTFSFLTSIFQQRFSFSRYRFSVACFLILHKFFSYQQ